LSNFNTAPLRNQQAMWQITTGVDAGISRTRDRQFTWRHNTYSHCRLRFLHHNCRWQ